MQYFYLVVTIYDESTYPMKIFLQEKQAIKYGRRLASKLQFEGCYEVVLFKQPITAGGVLERVKTLLPFKGADWDIDK